MLRMIVRRCLFFVMVMFSAALFGFYGSGNEVNAQSTNASDKGTGGRPLVMLQNETPGTPDQGNINISGTAIIGGALDATIGIGINGSTVIDSAGKWVGNPTGLVGPQGLAGAAGATGPVGPQGTNRSYGSNGSYRAKGLIQV